MGKLIYKGKEYPVREFKMTSENTGEVSYTVADNTLLLDIQKINGEFKGKKETLIDESIYFYVEEGILSLPAEEICANHLDMQFEFISEEK